MNFKGGVVDKEAARIRVRVQPNAGRNQILGLQEGVWQVKIAAPPVKGKANQELLEYLGGVLGVGRGRLSLEKGAASRSKVIAVDGLGPDEVASRLEGLSRRK